MRKHKAKPLISLKNIVRTVVDPFLLEHDREMFEAAELLRVLEPDGHVIRKDLEKEHD